MNTSSIRQAEIDHTTVCENMRKRDENKIVYNGCLHFNLEGCCMCPKSPNRWPKSRSTMKKLAHAESVYWFLICCILNFELPKKHKRKLLDQEPSLHIFVINWAVLTSNHIIELGYVQDSTYSTSIDDKDVRAQIQLTHLVDPTSRRCFPNHELYFSISLIQYICTIVSISRVKSGEVDSGSYIRGNFQNYLWQITVVWT